MEKTGWMCPVCGEKLIESEKSFSCANRHLFDKAKKGYVNLLLGRDGSLHGDSKAMAQARFEVMEEGLFAPLKDAVVAALKAVLPATCCIADCGCGECYYSAAVQAAFPAAQLLASDISKEALAVANRRDKRIRRAVASTFALPIADKSCDAALNLFSPFVREEYARILKPHGILLMVIPLEDHLWELKEAVYEKPYKNEPKQTALEGFTLLKATDITYQKTVGAPLLQALFAMTPYALKTAPEDAAKLQAINQLDIHFSLKVLVYKKEN